MPPALVPPQLRREAFLGSDAMRRGLLTARQLDGPSWRRLFHGVYVHRDVEVTHELRARGAVLLLPAAVVTGLSAAVLWGIDLAGPSDDVELTVPPTDHPHRVKGLRVRRATLPDASRWRRSDVPVTTAAATAVRVAGLLPLDDAVVAVDQLVETGVVDLEPIRRLAAATSGAGSARARAACALADGLAGSPQETRLRLLIGRSGLPMPVAQYRVQLNGRSLARVDFAWPDKKVALEYDGLWHAETGQFAKDRQRLNRLREAGWQVVFVLARDLHHPDELIARIAAALTG
jgi:hypothetical protein